MPTEVQGVGRPSEVTEAENHLINATEAMQTALEELTEIIIKKCDGSEFLPVRVQTNAKILFQLLVDHRNDLEFEMASSDN